MKVASVAKVSMGGRARWSWQGFCKGRFGGPRVFDSVDDAKAAALAWAKPLLA
jgi:hypothetical protein